MHTSLDFNLYQAFGLRFATDLPIVEFLESSSVDHPIDVHIRAGQLPESLPGQHSSLRLQGNAQQLLLNFNKVARFLIEDGKKITYCRIDDVDDDTFRLFLLGSCMGALLQQRGYIVLHGNAISTDRQTCTIFVGHRGAGKSTKAAASFRQGANILSDDVCAVSFDGQGRPMVIPGYPQIKIWADAAQMLGIDTAPLRRVRPQDEKFALPIHAQFYHQPLPLARLVEIRPDLTQQQPRSGAEKINILTRHSYRYHFLRKMGFNLAYVKQLMRLADRIEIKTVGRDAIATL